MQGTFRGILASSPLNETSRPRDVISSAEETLTEVANNSSEGATDNATVGNVQTTKAGNLQPTGPPVVMVKPGRCPIVGFLAHVSQGEPHDGYPLLSPLARGRAKRGSSSSSSEEHRRHRKKGTRRRYRTYHHHPAQQRPNPCKAPDCGMDGDCTGELKCCAVPGCRKKCLRPLPSEQLPGTMQRFHA
ncbi:uncharacterized protein LOC143841421 isoform X2 [Paroedura picta]|uniref:uncharacterized protein LOC143841421 isoform X2 n=1 Tax=Paroedura picta TaxID=143630 RepID=UPI0040575B1B